MHGRELAIAFRQVPPGRTRPQNPQHSVEILPMVMPRPTTSSRFGEQMLDALPLRVREFVTSDHSSSLTASSLHDEVHASRGTTATPMIGQCLVRSDGTCGRRMGLAVVCDQLGSESDNPFLVSEACPAPQSAPSTGHSG